MNNLNTTVDKIAMSEFDMHYYQLGDNEKQWCHDELVNNKKWLDPEWKQPGYESETDKLCKSLGIFDYKGGKPGTIIIK